MATKVTRNAGWMLDITSGHNIRLGLTLLVVQHLILCTYMDLVDMCVCYIRIFCASGCCVFYLDHKMI